MCETRQSPILFFSSHLNTDGRIDPDGGSVASPVPNRDPSRAMDGPDDSDPGLAGLSPEFQAMLGGFCAGGERIWDGESLGSLPLDL